MLDESMVGDRMSIRRRVPGEIGPTGGPAMTDVVGRLLRVGDGHATVERRDGTQVTIRLADVVAARRVPDGPRRTRPADTFAPADLARICTRGWPPVESEPLGEWLLRAASGFTSRANSVAVHGDPGLAVDAALDRVVSYYTVRALPPRAQVIEGSDGERQLEAAGWRSIGGTHDHALVQVAGVREALAAADAPTGDVTVADTVDDDWLALYNRAEGAASDAAVRAVLQGPPTVGFVRLGDPPVAIGRVAVTGEWAGMSCVEVAPGHRRRGLARRIVDASLRWASERGADKAYLQTMRHNDAALGLYAAYGFRDHHAYRYLAPVP